MSASTSRKRILISVSDKTGIDIFAKALAETGCEIISTGGTADYLRTHDIPVMDISDLTGFPEMLDGRVKTLHPHVHGGILARRDDSSHMQALQSHNIQPIDMVVVNLYPFEATVQAGKDANSCIENIDIGGPGLIRAAAKNHGSVAIIVDPADYDMVIKEWRSAQDTLSQATLTHLAGKAYAHTAAYDAAIANWFHSRNELALPEQLLVTARHGLTLHYGENPHQHAGFYRTGDNSPSIATAQLVHGERLSYNNINDTNAALELVAEFTEPSVAIIKHANPCGVASSDTSLVDAFSHAYACDKVSAYGGIIAVNREVDTDLCDALKAKKLFVEVLIAPSITEEALARLSTRKKLRILITGGMPDPTSTRWQVKSIRGGMLYQQEDSTSVQQAQLKLVTKAIPNETLIHDALFAEKVAKHVKSNAIVMVRNKATIGIGAGQMSRVDSTRLAIWKAENAGLDTKGSVLASDAFFPFPDNVEQAAEAGVALVIQPGGSIRDEEVIASADAKGVHMVLSGIRHFKH